MSVLEPVGCLVFPASLRHDSLNGRRAVLVKSTIEASGGKVDFAAMREFDCPSYDGDVQDAEGFPPGAEVLRRRLAEADALVICSPEYNSSMPGALKNSINWVSHYHPQPFKGKHCLLMSASPSMAGGNRGLWAPSRFGSSSSVRPTPQSPTGSNNDLRCPACAATVAAGVTARVR